jgi:hypothetical protein
VCSNSGRESQKLWLYDQIFGKEFNLGFHQPNQRLSRACIVLIVLTWDHMGKYRNIFFSEAIALVEPKLCINHWKVLYKLRFFNFISEQKT